MTDKSDNGALRVPERIVPVPAHASAQARAMLSQPVPPKAQYPALDDAAGWKAHIATMDANVATMFAGRLGDFAHTLTEWREEGALAYDIRPEHWSDADRRVYLYIHGGGLIMGAGEVCKTMTLASTGSYNVRVVSVDYRMPPDHPYPASLDDCMVFYRALLREYQPHQIIIGGGSAGGNLAAATILRARDEGLPLPAAAVLMSPELDLTESGDSHQTNAGLDSMGSLMQANLLYAGGRDLTDPYISPLFGDMAKGFPPTFLSTGTRDLFLSNTVRMHRKLRNAGIHAELHIKEAAPHAGLGSGPEDMEIEIEARGFCMARWAGR
ncbi:MAG: alpha/beta hydrolase fold domain-containing protein [Novosphingobium sp.]|nr:alpha/beta hydrolase fold domain-containing protein [Novosphingobium sp.]